MPKLLENITYDSEGLVLGATSLMNVWLMQYNAGEKVEGQGGNSIENTDLILLIFGRTIMLIVGFIF